MTSRPLTLALLALAPAFAFAEAPAAAGPSAAEARLRDALRQATVRMRTLESDLESARTALETKEKELVSLRKKSEAQERRAQEELALGAKQITSLNARITALTTKAGALEETNERTRAEATRLAATLTTTEAERARLRLLTDRLTLRVADRERHNVELLTLGEEILTRFERYGLGEAIAGKEPFIGAKRVKLRAIVQEYADKLADQKVLPGKPAAAESGAGSVTAAR